MPDGVHTNAGAGSEGADRDTRPNKSNTHFETGSIVLNASVKDVYGHCCRFQEFPRFLKSLPHVEKIDDTHFQLTTLERSEERRIILQIVLRVPERRIAWQANCSECPQGVVLIEQRGENKTEVTVKVRSTLEAATLAQLMREYLTSFKKFVEGQTLF